MSSKPAFRVLTAVEDSDTAPDVVRAAADIATRFEAELHLLHVVDRPWRSRSDYAAALTPAELEEAGGAPLARLTSLAREVFSGEVEGHLTSGPPSEEIVREAERLGASIVVVGTHGRTGLSRALLGSVAEQVVRYAPCAVFVARPM